MLNDLFYVVTDSFFLFFVVNFLIQVEFEEHSDGVVLNLFYRAFIQVKGLHQVGMVLFDVCDEIGVEVDAKIILVYYLLVVGLFVLLNSHEVGTFIAN